MSVGQTRRKILFLALGWYCAFGFTGASYLLPVYYTKIGLGASDAGLLVAVFYFASIATRPFLGSVVTRTGFRSFFLAAGILSVVCSLIIALAGPRFWIAMAARAALGLASSMMQIGLATFQAVAFEERERGRAFSLIMAGGIVPMMTAVPAAEWLLLRGYTSLYIFVPLAICVAATIIMPSTPGLSDVNIPLPTSGKSANPFRGMGECLRIPAFRLAILSMFLFSVADASASFMSSMTAHFGLMASLFLSSNALVGLLVRLFLARYLDRFPRWMLAAPTVMITSGTLLLSTFSPTETRLVAMGLLFGIGMGIGFPLHLALISDSVPMRLQPQAVSICWFLIGLGFTVIPLFMGWLGGMVGPVIPLRVTSGIALCGTVTLAVFWHVRHRRARAFHRTGNGVK
ncbi:MFS transporter [Synergistaceae bacterium OttesenSCG-928-I11]|nr:MFS transporter [Synergistaceae bacterium OttesenSCG-928-I11]